MRTYRRWESGELELGKVAFDLTVAGDVTPTHWMPLPAAPAAQAAESEGL
jgi:hypothetical protein